DLLPPAGGLYGAAGIVNVAQGTIYAFDATAIDGFSDIAQHRAPGDAKPNLSTAVTGRGNQIRTGYGANGHAENRPDYPASRAIDAFSAVFTADQIFGDFDSEAKLGATSGLILSAPTKPFYVDPGIVGVYVDSYIQPFEETFGGGEKFTIDNQNRRVVS